MALQQVSAEQPDYWRTFSMSSPPLVDVICSPKGKGSDISMSADDASLKVRKPYTITKQRERWTEDEHQKFLDALKLHGRAWRRIEEHIGTKTAVQIRSHAQKFFLKLEREASLGGPLTTAGSGEIEIPPPRPKRKPSRPYPKKASGAFSGSPPNEEDCKSPPAIYSAFTPLESSSGRSIPTKKNRSSAASLRLFGQTFVPGSDKVEVDTDLMESTGSPRSQISVETEETSGVSPLISNTASDIWDQNATVSKPHETASPLSGANSQQCPASNEWKKSSIAVHANKADHSNEKNAAYVSSPYECHSDVICFTPWHPGSFSLGEHHLTHYPACVPTLWQGIVPPGFIPGTSEDVNMAAAAYALASAWQAIQGALANPKNDSTTSVVYNPIAMPAAARQPIPISRLQSPDAHTYEQAKRKQRGGYSGSGNEDEGNSIHGEESTAECCSSLTDTSRLSAYESNDEGVPAAKKCRRKFSDNGMNLDMEAPESPKILTGERVSRVIEHSSSSSEALDISQNNNDACIAIHSRSTDDHIDGPSDRARLENSSVSKSLQPEDSTAKISVHVITSADQPVDLITQACRLNTPLMTGECCLKEKGAPKHGNDSDEVIISSSSEEENKASVSKECSNTYLHNDGGNNTFIESEHLFMIKTGATVSSRYSGVGFVPYTRSIKVESSSKA